MRFGTARLPRRWTCGSGRSARLGLAVGDALGAPFEFRRGDGDARPAAGARAVDGPPPGTTTDDTAMARNLSDSLIGTGELDTADVLARHLAWLETDPPTSGTTRGWCSRRRAAARRRRRASVERRGPEVSAGNGSVMYARRWGWRTRATPSGSVEAPALSRDHPLGRALRDRLPGGDAGGRRARPGRGRRAAVVGAVEAVASQEGDEELEHLVDQAGRAGRSTAPTWGPRSSPPGRTAGRRRGARFEEGLRHVVGLGGDTDINAAVAGALLGARHGRGGIPPPGSIASPTARRSTPKPARWQRSVA